MLTIPELEERLRTQYPTAVTDTTQRKRLHNIQAFQTLIREAINENGLVYGEKEERLQLFETSQGETVSIQYPGKESERTETREQGNNVRQLDFRPKIQLPNGALLRDFTFADQWSAVETINRGHQQVMKSLATVFFHIGRMTYHELRTINAEYCVIDQDGFVVPDAGGTKQIELYVPVFSDDVKEALDYNCSGIQIDGCDISFEAFLLFFNLLIEQEDSKYYDKKGNLSSGRITTSDSMLLLASYFSGSITLSDLLQKYVSGFGAAKCPINEISDATGGLVEIVDRYVQLRAALEEKNIPFREGSTIRVNGESLRYHFKIEGKHILIVPRATNNQIERLQADGWSIYVKDELIPFEHFSAVLNSLD